MNKELKELTLKFHYTYERKAEEFNYETRNDTKVFNFESANGKLMYATVKEVMLPYLKQLEDIKSYIKNSDLDKMLWGKELLKILDREEK